MPEDGMYKCDWSESGLYHFEGIKNGYSEMYSRLESYFHMDHPTEPNKIEYFDRIAETLTPIRSQEDFETALKHASQKYSPFSILIKVNAPLRNEHLTNGVDFGKAWRVSKPKFACIRSWLVSLEKEAKVCENVSETCSYGKKIVIAPEKDTNIYLFWFDFR